MSKSLWDGRGEGTAETAARRSSVWGLAPGARICSGKLTVVPHALAEIPALIAALNAAATAHAALGLVNFILTCVHIDRDMAMSGAVTKDDSP